MASNVNANSGNLYKNCDKCGEPMYYGTSHICESSTDMVRKAIAARDKWFINRLNEEHIVIRLTDDQDEFTPGDYVAMPLERWHVLKREVGQ